MDPKDSRWTARKHQFSSAIWGLGLDNIARVRVRSPKSSPYFPEEEEEKEGSQEAAAAPVPEEAKVETEDDLVIVDYFDSHRWIFLFLRDEW